MERLTDKDISDYLEQLDINRNVFLQQSRLEFKAALLDLQDAKAENQALKEALEGLDSLERYTHLYEDQQP